jgi:hypothetical protein
LLDWRVRRVRLLLLLRWVLVRSWGSLGGVNLSLERLRLLGVALRHGLLLLRLLELLLVISRVRLLLVLVSWGELLSRGSGLLGRVERPLGTTRACGTSLRSLHTYTSKSITASNHFAAALRARARSRWLT